MSHDHFFTILDTLNFLLVSIVIYFEQQITILDTLIFLWLIIFVKGEFFCLCRKKQ